MNPRELARTYAGGRIFFGVLFLLLPGRLVRDFVPDPGRGAKSLARMVGVRDAVLGAGTLVALEDEGGKTALRPWMTYAAVSDAVDAFGILLAYRQLPKYKRFVYLFMALGGAGTGGYLMSVIDD